LLEDNVELQLVNGEGMVNYYLCAFGNKEKIIGRDRVNKGWYEFSVQIGHDIEEFLKFFSIDMPVVVDNLEFTPLIIFLKFFCYFKA
jgi:hypothetical protein